jgi:hypothetical protein
MTATTFINCTPHDIVFNDGTVFSKSGTVARVSATFSEIANGMCDQVFGTVQDLPEPSNGTFFIVSAVVLTAAKLQGRLDCVAPATGHPAVVRNEAGHIVSVPCFVR